MEIDFIINISIHYSPTYFLLYKSPNNLKENKQQIEVNLENKNQIISRCFKDLIENPKVLVFYPIFTETKEEILMTCEDIFEKFLFNTIGNLLKEKNVKKMFIEIEMDKQIDNNQGMTKNFFPIQNFEKHFYTF